MKIRTWILNKLNFPGNIKSRIEFQQEKDIFAIRKKNFITELKQNRVIIDKIKNGTVLAVGFGEGGDLAALSELGARRVFGTEINRRRLESVKSLTKEYKNIEYILVESEIVPFEKEKFDFILCAEVIEHVPHPEILLSELKRVVKGDGLIYISFPSFSSIKGPHFWHVIRVPFAQFLFGLKIMEEVVTLILFKEFGEKNPSFNYLNGLTIRNFVKLCKREDVLIDDLWVFSPFLLMKPLTFLPILDDLGGDCVRATLKKLPYRNNYLNHKISQFKKRIKNWLILHPPIT